MLSNSLVEFYSLLLIYVFESSELFGNTLIIEGAALPYLKNNLPK
jgi:hypothetical protein